MKIILSRKGFDSSSGGVASPIFDNGEMVSLPIPDNNSEITYGDISSRAGNLGKIVEGLTRGRITRSSYAHLDPDIERNAMKRTQGWRPIFGQINQAQGHLRKQGIDVGDLFLFFGWFNNVTSRKGVYSHSGRGDGVHVLWGWFQIGDIDIIDKLKPDQKKWARYHPHFHQELNNSNTLYTASKNLSLPNHSKLEQPGSGVFHKFSDSLLLSDARSYKKSVWKLPHWFYPENPDKALSFHTDMARWSKHDNYVKLQTVGRGQEFVFDTEYYPESIEWLKELIQRNYD